MPYLVSIMSRYIVNLTSGLWTSAKRVLRYLKGTIDSGLIYEEIMKDLKVIGYSCSDFHRDVEDRKSTPRQVFFLGGLPITWNILKQKVVAFVRSWICSNYISRVSRTMDCEVSEGANGSWN